MSRRLDANLSIAIQTIGAQKLRTLAQGVGANVQAANALAKTYDRLAGQQRRLERLQSAARSNTFIGKGVDRSVGVLNAAAKGFSTAIDVGSKLFLTTHLIAGGFRTIAGAVNTVIEPLKEFESAMAQVQIKGGFDSATTTRLAKQAKQMGRTTAFAPTEAAKAQIALAASDLTEEQIVANVPTILKFSQASGMGTEESADYLVNVARQFQMDLNDPTTLSKVGSAIKNAADASTISERDLQQTLKYAGPIAKEAGYGVAEAASMAAIMGNSGLKGSQSGTGLRNLFSSFAKPKGGKITAELLEEIGLTKEELNANIENIPSFLELMEDRMLAKGWDKGKRIALAASLFGQYGMTAAMVLQRSAGSTADVLVNGITKMTAAVNGSLSSLDTAAEIRGNTIEGRMATLNARWETLRVTIGEKLAPVVIQVLDQITTKISDWESSVAMNDPRWVETLENVKIIFAELPQFIETAVAALKAFNATFGSFLDVYKAFSGEGDSKLGTYLRESTARRNAYGVAWREGRDRANGEYVDPSNNVSNPEDGGASMPEPVGYSEDLGFTPPGGYPEIPETPTAPLAQQVSALMSQIDQLSSESSEPSVVELRVTTDKGTTAEVTKIKKGAQPLRVSTNANR